MTGNQSLPPNWIEVRSSTTQPGRDYYFNIKTRKSVWTVREACLPRNNHYRPHSLKVSMQEQLPQPPLEPPDDSSGSDDPVRRAPVPKTQAPPKQAPNASNQEQKTTPTWWSGQPSFGPNGQPPFGPNGQPPFGPNGQPPFGPNGQPPFGPNGQPPFGPNMWPGFSPYFQFNPNNMMQPNFPPGYPAWNMQQGPFAPTFAAPFAAPFGNVNSQSPMPFAVPTVPKVNPTNQNAQSQTQNKIEQEDAGQSPPRGSVSTFNSFYSPENLPLTGAKENDARPSRKIVWDTERSKQDSSSPESDTAGGTKDTKEVKLSSDDLRFKLRTRALANKEPIEQDSASGQHILKRRMSCPTADELNDMQQDSMDDSADEISKDITEDSTNVDPLKGESYGYWLLKTAPPQARQDLVYICLDTNIYLCRLDFVHRLFNQDKEGICRLLVPVCVNNELGRLGDLAKRKVNRRFLSNRIKQQRKRSAAAIGFLLSHINRKPSFVITQSAIEAKKMLISHWNPDDEIASCCVQYMKKNIHVVLVTNDISLCTKAAHCEIPCYQLEQMSEMLDKVESDLKKRDHCFKLQVSVPNTLAAQDDEEQESENIEEMQSNTDQFQERIEPFPQNRQTQNPQMGSHALQDSTYNAPVPIIMPATFNPAFPPPPYHHQHGPSEYIPTGNMFVRPTEPLRNNPSSNSVLDNMGSHIMQAVFNVEKGGGYNSHTISPNSSSSTTNSSQKSMKTRNVAEPKGYRHVTTKPKTYTGEPQFYAAEQVNYNWTFQKGLDEQQSYNSTSQHFTAVSQNVAAERPYDTAGCQNLYTTAKGQDTGEHVNYSREPKNTTKSQSTVKPHEITPPSSRQNAVTAETKNTTKKRRILVRNSSVEPKPVIEKKRWCSRTIKLKEMIPPKSTETSLPSLTSSQIAVSTMSSRTTYPESQSISKCDPIRSVASSVQNPTLSFQEKLQTQSRKEPVVSTQRIPKLKEWTDNILRNDTVSEIQRQSQKSVDHSRELTGSGSRHETVSTMQRYPQSEEWTDTTKKRAVSETQRIPQSRQWTGEGSRNEAAFERPRTPQHSSGIQRREASSNTEERSVMLTEELVKALSLQLENCTCAFVQIMEDVLSTIVLQECSSYFIQPPWSLCEAAVMVARMCYDRHKDLLDIAKRFSSSIEAVTVTNFGFPKTQKVINYKFKKITYYKVSPKSPEVFVGLVSEARTLLAALKNVLCNIPEIDTADCSILDMLDDLQSDSVEKEFTKNPSPKCYEELNDGDGNPDQVFKPKRSIDVNNEVIMFLKNHYKAWETYTEETTETNAQKEKDKEVNQSADEDRENSLIEEMDITTAEDNSNHENGNKNEEEEIKTKPVVIIRTFDKFLPEYEKKLKNNPNPEDLDYIYDDYDDFEEDEDFFEGEATAKNATKSTENEQNENEEVLYEIGGADENGHDEEYENWNGNEMYEEVRENGPQIENGEQIEENGEQMLEYLQSLEGTGQLPNLNEELPNQNVELPSQNGEPPNQNGVLPNLSGEDLGKNNTDSSKAQDETSVAEKSNAAEVTALVGLAVKTSLWNTYACLVRDGKQMSKAKFEQVALGRTTSMPTMPGHLGVIAQWIVCMDGLIQDGSCDAGSLSRTLRALAPHVDGLPEPREVLRHCVIMRNTVPDVFGNAIAQMRMMSLAFKKLYNID